ncbi:MAG: lipoate--protein ligase family protein [Candidatus Omnitrophica bacterium]|nr:lipoate--protein ligase family protein [Candidatus Omnitrophota bacterium]
MRVEDLSFLDPRQNLDYDDQLLNLADRQGAGEVLRFWESPSVFVVLGRTCQEEADVDSGACAQDGIPVLRRSSGGGTVVQGPGCLNFSLILSKVRHQDLASIPRSYEFILLRVLNVLKGAGVSAGFRPICDLVLSSDEKKFSGNAQRRGRGYILHHGTILYNADLSLISRYLRMPSRMPEYRRTRPHADFITNVSLDVPAFKERMGKTFSVL